MDNSKIQFLEKQIETYKKQKQKYDKLSTLLQEILNNLILDRFDAIIQSRSKTITSFAEKIYRKKTKYSDPFKEITDLCACRIILSTINDVDLVCKLIKKTFIVIPEHSEDKLELLSFAEFGYLSRHFIVKLDRDYSKFTSLEIPDELYGIAIEIQIRTILQHAWAQIQHDAEYKGNFDLPSSVLRKFYRTSAVLENTDHDFNEIVIDMNVYRSNYGSYLTDNQIQDEIQKWKLVLFADNTDIKTVLQLVKLHRYKEGWGEIIQLLEKLVYTNNKEILRELGLALCKKYNNNPSKFENGLKYLEKALTLDPNNIETLCCLGGRWKNRDNAKALDYYRKAFRLNQRDPYASGNYFILELHEKKKIQFLQYFHGTIRELINVCDNQIENNINIPWAFFDKGLFHLLLGEISDGLEAYIFGITNAHKSWMLETTLESIKLIVNKDIKLKDVDLFHKLLLIGLAIIHGKKEVSDEIRLLSKLEPKEMEKPVIIIAGKTNDLNDEMLLEFEPNFLESFSNFNGTIISGGTKSGICGFVGLITESNNKINSIGFLPKLRTNSDIDKRYTKLVTTNGIEYSEREPIQYWIELISQFEDLEKVKLLGFSGGKISLFEYRIALLLGIEVGLIKDSGESASIIVSEKHIHTTKKNISFYSKLHDVSKSVTSIQEFLEYQR